MISKPLSVVGRVLPSLLCARRAGNGSIRWAYFITFVNPFPRPTAFECCISGKTDGPLDASVVAESQGFDPWFRNSLSLLATGPFKRRFANWKRPGSGSALMVSDLAASEENTGDAC